MYSFQSADAAASEINQPSENNLLVKSNGIYKACRGKCCMYMYVYVCVCVFCYVFVCYHVDCTYKIYIHVLPLQSLQP